MTLLCWSLLGFVQFLDKVVNMPVVVQIFDKVVDVPVVQARRLSECAENCGAPQLQFSDKVDMPVVVNDSCLVVLQVQFLRLCVIEQRRRVSRPVKVPQIEFIAGVSGHSSFATDWTHSANCAAFSLGAVYGGCGGDDVFLVYFRPFFALRPSGR